VSLVQAGERDGKFIQEACYGTLTDVAHQGSVAWLINWLVSACFFSLGFSHTVMSLTTW
jgi:hypothetical protein